MQLKEKRIGISVKLTPDEVKALEAPYQPHGVRGM